MFTFHHGFWIYFFTRQDSRVWYFVIGSMLPDYIYFMLLGILLTTGQIVLRDLPNLSPTTFMGYVPYYPWVMQIDLIGHSVVFCSVAFLLAFVAASRRLQALVVGWGTHLLIDGLTHAAHANFYLYPFSLLATHSPVSYWEPEYFAGEFKLVNGILMAIAFLYLVHWWWKKRPKEG